MASVQSTLEGMEKQVEAEFLEESRDIINELDVLLGNVHSKQVKADEAIDTLRRSFISMEVRGRSVSQPIIAIVVHRAFEYVADLKDLGEQNIIDIQAFIDQIRRVLDGDVRQTLDSSAELVRNLPAKKGFDFDPSQIKRELNIEGMLVIPDKAMARIVERELVNCGYRISNAKTAFQAFEMGVRTRPDFIIAAAVLDDLSGIDIACAFAAMPSTTKIPFAILTSFAWGHPSLDGIPPRTAIIRKGQFFSDDLAEALSRFKIT